MMNDRGGQEGETNQDRVVELSIGSGHNQALADLHILTQQEASRLHLHTTHDTRRTHEHKDRTCQAMRGPCVWHLEDVVKSALVRLVHSAGVGSVLEEKADK